jgi:hypothetical protein
MTKIHAAMRAEVSSHHDRHRSALTRIKPLAFDALERFL